MAASDFRTNTAVRSVLARHWIDLQRIKFGCFRGTVRFSGSLAFLGTRANVALDASKVELLEREIKRLQEVSRVYFDLKNWKKEPGREWRCLIQPTSSSNTILDECERDSEVLVAKTTPTVSTSSSVDQK